MQHQKLTLVIPPELTICVTERRVPSSTSTYSVYTLSLFNYLSYIHVKNQFLLQYIQFNQAAHFY